MLRLKLFEIVKTSADATISEYVFRNEYDVETYDSFKSLTEIATFTFVIDINQIIDTQFTLADDTKFHYFQFFIDGVLTEEGYINSFSLSADGQKMTILGDDLLYSLTVFRAPAHYYAENQQIFDAASFLVTASISGLVGLAVFDEGWQPPSLNELHLAKTMIDPIETITIDLGTEKTIWSALTKLFNSAEQPIYARRGVSLSGFKAIEIGAFDKNVEFTYDNKNIVNLTISKTKEIPTSYITPFGGTYSDGVDLFVIDLTFATKPAKPNYAYSTTFNWVKDENVYNNVIVSKSELLYFDDIIPGQGIVSPSLPQIEQAANALYKRTVAYLKKNINIYEFSLTTNEFSDDIDLGCRIRVNYKPKSTFYNATKRHFETIEIENLAIVGFFYVKSIGLSIDANGKRTYQLTLSNDNNFRSSANDVTLYKTAVKNISKTNQYRIYQNSEQNCLGYYTEDVVLAPGASTTVTFDKIADGDFGDVVNIPENDDIVATYLAWIDDRQLTEQTFSVVPTTGVSTFTVNVTNTSGNNPVKLNVLVYFSDTTL